MKSISAIRVMMTTDCVGGVWSFATTLARALGEYGDRVLLVTLGQRPSVVQHKMLRGCRNVTLIETDLELEWQDPIGSDVSRARATLGDIAARFKPDLVHLNGFREANFHWGLPSIVVAHSCVNSWASACGEINSFSGKEWGIYSANVRDGLRHADAWVAPTVSFRDQMVRYYDVAAKGIAIPNGINATGACSERKQAVILGAGRLWDKAKNLAAICAIAADIEWPIRIAGPVGSEQGTIPDATAGCEILGEISRDELLRQMQSASIFVSPALYEPFGLAVLEAASAGCALVLSDIPAFRELWNGAAVFFDPRDRNALEGHLRALCRDELGRARLQQAAAKRAGQYKLRNTVRSYRALYASLLSANLRSSHSSAEVPA
jgi:glycosyltransferase involved in cell wall biosynthesis